MLVRLFLVFDEFDVFVYGLLVIHAGNLQEAPAPEKTEEPDFCLVAEPVLSTPQPNDLETRRIWDSWAMPRGAL